MIFVDMDGVLTDFIGDVREFYPDMDDWAPDDVLWPAVISIPYFWEDMSWMPGGKELWEYVKKVGDPYVCSAPTRLDVRSPSGKLIWIHKNLGFDTHYVFTRSSRKRLLAAPGRVLIDDLKDNVEGWIKAGGIGIHHKNADDTINQLVAIGNNFR